MKLEINEQEKNILIQLIDLAVKSGGLQVSEAGTLMAKKINSLKEEPVEPKEPKIEDKPKK